MRRFISAFLFPFVLTSCFMMQGSRGVDLQKASYHQLSGWNIINIYPGFQGFQKSCAVISGSKVRSSRLFSDNKKIWQEKCTLAKRTRSPKQFFENNFTPYLVLSNGSPKGKFTGYFEKEIEASPVKTGMYKYPIYAEPADKSLLSLTRKEIENGALEGKSLEIAYAKSQAQLYFLHIQGSGILKFPDGKKMAVGFAAKNNAQYTSIGRYMLDQGLLEHGSADEIEQWLDAHPVSGRTIMNMNDRYVFFSLKNGGPYGSIGVELTDQGSMAVDPENIPLGTPLWVQTTLSSTKKSYFKLLNAQDTGSDIKGAIRGDIFFGKGVWASSTASSMNSAGKYFVLIPNEINPEPYF